ncbi:YfhO family protein [Enterococcus casseliflavus]|uniref:YfhO family protein n=1 Tax=Enterococcus casseliflavus TaxID=37734 RepID=UPI001BCE35FE|nr:YfhO family protein [Enterococcus casseliflavus]
MKTIRSFIRQHQSIILFTLLFGLIFIFGYYPLWSQKLSLIWNIDSVGQYYPAFIYTGRYLREFIGGLFSGQIILPGYDLSIGMGEDIIGSLNYYGFGDPLNIVSVFVTDKNAPYLFSFMIVFRMWLSGFALIKYFSYLRFDKVAVVFSALSYVFCGFSVIGGTRYIEWLSVLIFFPMILLGIEKIIRQKRFTLFVVSVMFAALCGFYFLFMVSVVLALYFPIRLLFKRLSLKYLFVSVGKGIFAYTLGILLAAPFFFPTLQGYFLSERKSEPISSIIFNLNNYVPNFTTNFGDLLTMKDVEPPIFLSGIIVIELLAIILLLFLPNDRKKAQCLIFLGIAFIASCLPITGYLFNGFGQTNDRWAFIVHLLLSGILAYVLTEYRKVLDNELVLHKGKNAKIGIVYFLIGTIIITNLIINLWGIYSDYGEGWARKFIPFETSDVYTTSPVKSSNKIEKDIELYRVSNDSLTEINGRPENVAMINDYYGLTYWLSVINKHTQETVDQYNQWSLRWRSYGFEDDSAMNTLSGVKYYLSKEPIFNDADYQQVETLSFNNERWYVYENKNFQGLAYILNKDEMNISDIHDEEDRSRLQKSIKDSTGNVRDITYDKNQFEINAIAGNDQSLVLSVPYHSNWKAYVNGNEVIPKITDWNHIEVPLDAGENQIEFIYFNPFLLVGFIAASISLIFCIFFIFFKKRKAMMSIKPK